MGAFTTPARTDQMYPAQPWLWARVLQPLTIADDDFLEVPAGYPTLNAPFDVFGTLAQLTP